MASGKTTSLTVRRRERNGRGRLAEPAFAVDWVEVKQNGQYKGEIFLEMTYYPAMKTAVSFASCPRRVLLIPTGFPASPSTATFKD